MLDFIKISTNSKGKLFADPLVKSRYKDLMIKGDNFMAFYNEKTGYWVTDIHELVPIIDEALIEHAKQKGLSERDCLLVKNFSNNQWESFIRFFKKLSDRYKNLDRTVLFNDAEVSRESYATFKLPYNMEDVETPAWEEIMSTLYEPEEREKIEWCIGCIIKGDSRKLQKFLVLYGEPGTGKGTVIEIIQSMFDGYCHSFSSETMGNANSSFALADLASNPLIGIDADGDMSKININTRLNTVISHEPMVVNEKYKAQYSMRFDTFLIIGTNTPVRITDTKSGLIRRLIDTYSKGDKIPNRRYNQLMKQVKFEYGGIAKHCLDVYEELGEYYYSTYEPKKMIFLTNEIHNFLMEYIDNYKDREFIPYKELYNDYKIWCEDNKINVLNGPRFKENIEPFFDDVRDFQVNGVRYRNCYCGFRDYKLDINNYDKDKKKPDEKETLETNEVDNDIPSWLELRKLEFGEKSKLDILLSDSQAQGVNGRGNPRKPWDEVTTTLKSINTANLHFVRPKDERHIFIDFDISGEDGKKDRKRNLKAASEFPPTYAEVSKSGEGLHLHYIYDGDVRELSSVFDDNIEIKIFPSDKKSAMRRKLSLTNNIDISHISSGLPLRKEIKKDLINKDVEITERDVRIKVKRCLNKEYEKMPKTILNVMFIKKLLDDLYSSGKAYDVSDLFKPVHSFASASHNSAGKCLELVSQMKWCSKEYEVKETGGALPVETVQPEDDRPMVFYDVEVFQNLFVICWKVRGAPECVRMINPGPEEVRKLFEMKLVGFNNRDYDNHILYAAANGYSNQALFKISQGIIKGDKKCKFGNAYNLSYTDIYDFSNDKKSLKKWEIELGIHHLELGLPWDQPVPKELWDKVAEYCCNDVEATEALFNHLEDTDWTARVILSELSGLSRNETTNNHTCQIIFGNDKNPQREFIYTDLSKEFPGYSYNPYEPDPQKKSTYRGYYTKEGGYADGIEGIWYDVALLDIASMHPTTAKELQIFGPRYTARYYSLVETRLHIKHGEIDEARAMFDGAIGRIMDKYGFSIKKLSQALKIPINAVYGLTSAKFNNRCRDPRNVDNIVAKRGALFMITLRDEVRKLGYEIIHVKTDSVKIPNATPEIIQFVMDFGKKYGYTFEHEATYERICLVNHAVYIAKYADKDWCTKQYGYIPDKNNDHAGEWTATGTQFQIPYVFKTLFSHEAIEFTDMCETKEVKSPAAIYLRTEENGSNKDQFIGRIGLFCPVIDIGGDLMRVDSENNKEGAVTGTKGFKWLESEYVRTHGLEKSIDRNYYRILCDKAKETIEQYGPFEEFAV